MFRWISVELLPPAGGQQNLHRPKLDNSTYLILLCVNTYQLIHLTFVLKRMMMVTLRGKRKNAAKALKKIRKENGSVSEQLQRTAVRHVQKKQRVH